ncbi:LPXTG cell wall anchor domain-containing protein [Candidatus Neomicrothrix sp.]|uniref:LPXTG cell wall anchor domain-containing protein n=1 Tax=Candidatus Neomicrothrix sp. TaxID=2719034 RepID=UPI001B512475|nr:LPXTG cell wall anchor domain-containing protein [Candidatus Microthrix sp.]MBP6150819.1 LPXTG cell wall anchor domain-containing protein [Candidatus Microthrix sp.]
MGELPRTGPSALHGVAAGTILLLLGGGFVLRNRCRVARRCPETIVGQRSP